MTILQNRLALTNTLAYYKICTLWTCNVFIVHSEVYKIPKNTKIFFILGSFSMSQLARKSGIMSFSLLLKLILSNISLFDCHKGKICHLLVVKSIRKKDQKEFPRFTIVDNSPKHTSFDKHTSLLQNMYIMDL